MSFLNPPLGVVNVLNALVLSRESKPSVTGAVMRFRTLMDAKVCPICAPLNGRIWRYDNPSSWHVPPLDTHPNCRCDLEYEEWTVIPQEERDIKLEKVWIDPETPIVLEHGGGWPGGGLNNADRKREEVYL